MLEGEGAPIEKIKYWHLMEGQEVVRKRGKYNKKREKKGAECNI
jgi:hypothetical protein